LTIWAAILLPLPFVAYLVAVGDAPRTSCSRPRCSMVVAYSAPKLRFKERPFLDSMTSSFHFVSPAVYGVLLAGLRPDLTVWWRSGPTSCGGWPRTRSARCRT
jgi:4-hydroxybenzoate polyprenyltransferase